MSNKVYATQVMSHKKYYLDKNQEKQYLTGEVEKDKGLIEAALLSGQEIESEQFVAHTAYGKTPEEAISSANSYTRANPDKLKECMVEEPVELEAGYEKDTVY